MDIVGKRLEARGRRIDSSATHSLMRLFGGIRFESAVRDVLQYLHLFIAEGYLADHSLGSRESSIRWNGR